MPLVNRIASTGPARWLEQRIRQSLHKYSKFDGYERIALSKLLSIFAKSRDHAVVPMRNGARIKVKTADHVGRVLYFMGDFQPQLSWAITRLLKRGDSALDIGANMGWFIVTAAPSVGETGVIHAFEPQPELISLLKETVELNNFTQVHIHGYGLSDHDGVSVLRTLPGNLGAGRLGSDVERHWDSVTVEIRRADDALEKLGLTSLRLLKIDIEGHELTFLNSAEAVLRRVPPDVIIFESNIDGTPFHDRPVVKKIKSLGYRMFQLHTHGDTLKAVEVRSDGAGTEAAADFIALKEGERLASDLSLLNG